MLREATNALACVGTLAIFVGSALAATAAAPPTTPAKLADAGAAAASKEDWTPAAEPEPGDSCSDMHILVPEPHPLPSIYSGTTRQFETSAR